MMAEIKDFIMMFLSVLAVSGIVISLSPEGGIKRYIRYICMLCLTAALCVPILQTLSSVPDRIAELPEEYGESAGEAGGADAKTLLIEQSKERIEESVADYVSGKYGFPRETVPAKALLRTDNTEEIEITELIVILPDLSRAEAVRSDLYEMFLRKTIITVRKGE